MADEKHHSGEAVDAEVKDRGLFDFLGKKEEHEGEKCQEEVLVTSFEKVQVSEEVEAKEEKKEEEKKAGLLEKLHRSHSSSSSSSSDEEEGAEGEEKKKKKKKGLTEKIKEKVSCQKKEGAEEHGEKVQAEAAAVVVEDNTIPVEKIEELAQPESEAQEKKSLLEKIKDKLPGGGQLKKPAEEVPAAPTDHCADQGKEHHEGDSPKEKKGFLGKIMDKIPGYHKTNGAEESGTASN